jgi:hypothetical protein
MATLVFSTVGTVLGGPIGGAIGALIGQSLDQQFLAPATRGPKLGDLSVQSSSYGTQIPRVYGSMRVAGSIIWATDLAESSETSGAKGQPDTVFSYSVSFAVALSSRNASSIGRIWADGKLLRGADGAFKVSKGFRFYPGSEDQDIDPLIASIEGISGTPAYRGLALAVFENLELADFGNRIPFLSFEVIADDGAPDVAAILADASDGTIAASSAQSIIGYAAYGPSRKVALQPLVETFGIDLFDDGATVRSAEAGQIAVSGDELGNSADEQKPAKVQRELGARRDVPTALRLTYYDAGRDYQAGEARAVAGEGPGAEERRELPAVVDATTAKSLVHRMMAQAWFNRDRMTLRLPPGRIGLEPGAELELPLAPVRWMVDECTIDGFVTVVELRPSGNGLQTVAADAGRIARAADIAPSETVLALIDAPAGVGRENTSPTLLLAASTAAPGWRPQLVDVAVGPQRFATRTAGRKAKLGRALNVLPASDPSLIDRANSVEVELIDSAQWLVSCDDDALATGANAAMIGGELVQFGEAVPNGPGRFILSKLARGRSGTESAIARHLADERFLLIEPHALREISLPTWSMGAVAIATTVEWGTSVTQQIAGARLRPLPPCDLQVTQSATDDLHVSWVRRSRAGHWLDLVDAPLGEAREAYRISLAGTGGVLERSSTVPEIVLTSADTAFVGKGPATIQVIQVGDWASSDPVVVSLNLL